MDGIGSSSTSAPAPAGETPETPAKRAPRREAHTPADIRAKALSPDQDSSPATGRAGATVDPSRIDQWKHRGSISAGHQERGNIEWKWSGVKRGKRCHLSHRLNHLNHLLPTSHFVSGSSPVGAHQASLASSAPADQTSPIQRSIHRIDDHRTVVVMGRCRRCSPGRWTGPDSDRGQKEIYIQIHIIHSFWLK